MRLRHPRLPPASSSSDRHRHLRNLSCRRSHSCIVSRRHLNQAMAPGITEGATVLGNFKGLGNWDEALVVACLPDGTYVLEYVDEGLIEEGVPASRVKLPSNASAQNAQEEEGNDGNNAAPREFVEGETVLGNFKGFGDWDEALVVACSDGTYVLEYVDEGLIEERVPASRIEKMGGADAEAQVSMAAGGRCRSR